MSSFTLLFTTVLMACNNDITLNDDPYCPSIKDAVPESDQTEDALESADGMVIYDLGAGIYKVTTDVAETVDVSILDSTGSLVDAGTVETTADGGSASGQLVIADYGLGSGTYTAQLSVTRDSACDDDGKDQKSVDFIVADYDSIKREVVFAYENGQAFAWGEEVVLSSEEGSGCRLSLSDPAMDLGMENFSALTVEGEATVDGLTVVISEGAGEVKVMGSCDDMTGVLMLEGQGLALELATSNDEADLGEQLSVTVGAAISGMDYATLVIINNSTGETIEIDEIYNDQPVTELVTTWMAEEVNSELSISAVATSPDGDQVVEAGPVYVQINPLQLYTSGLHFDTDDVTFSMDCTEDIGSLSDPFAIRFHLQTTSGSDGLLFSMTEGNESIRAWVTGGGQTLLVEMVTRVGGSLTGVDLQMAIEPDELVEVLLTWDYNQGSGLYNTGVLQDSDTDNLEFEELTGASPLVFGGGGLEYVTLSGWTLLGRAGEEIVISDIDAYIDENAPNAVGFSGSGLNTGDVYTAGDTIKTSRGCLLEVSDGEITIQ